MKLLHTGDIHLGKIVNEFSLIEDQRYVLRQISELAVEEKVDAVLIAGDVYDRAIPPVEAVELLDDFLTGLSQAGIKVILISGNHDSAIRVSFADRILEKQGIYLSGGYDGELKRVILSDEYGEVDIVCMPFIRPAVVGESNSSKAVEQMLSKCPMTLDLHSRHVLVTHFFVTGDQGEAPELSDSEVLVQVGGLDNVPASLFGMFDYVALGHIHKPQRMGEGAVYYAGTPLKYSFSEVNQLKGVNLVTMREKGVVEVVRRDLTPLHDMRIIKGTLEELLKEEVASLADRTDYIKAILTDTEELIDPIGSMRSVYPNVMEISLWKNQIREGVAYTPRLEVKHKCMEELFGEFYEILTDSELDPIRLKIVRKVAQEVENEESVL